MTTRPPWRITWGDGSWTADDVTGLHAVAVAGLLGREDWTALDPWTGIVTLMVWVAVLAGVPLTDVMAAPLSQILDAIDPIEE